LKFQQTPAGVFIQSLCEDHPDLPSRTLARMAYEQQPSLFKSIETARCMVRSYRGEGHKIKTHIPNSKTTAQKVEEVKSDINDKEACYTSKSTRITTLAQLIDHCMIDLEQWEIDRHVINKWEVGAKDDTGKIVVEPLFQIKVWLKRRVDYIRLKSVRDGFLNDITKATPVVPKMVYAKSKEPRLLEVSIADAHLGKLCWGEETGNDYDLKIALELYRETASKLLTVASKNIERILYVVGNDFFHTDTIINTTTNGTFQDTDTRWAKMFRSGCKVIRETADMMSKVAPVDIVCVSGNHDYERVFYLGEVLSAWYENNPNISVDASVKTRKYYRYHSNLIGFTHSDKEKISDMPLIMATECPDLWAKTKFREIHAGHIHKKKDIKWVDIDENRGVRMRFLPSISGIDQWHVSKGYSNLRCAEALEWTRDNGLAGTYSHNL